MSETTETMNTDENRVSNAEVEESSRISNATLDEQVDRNSNPTSEEQEDNLLELPPEKLAGMVRDKRKAEASVRSKLREAEAERDRLSGTVSGFRRQAFAAAAKESKVQDSAIEDVLGAVNIDDVLGEDGTVDAEKVEQSLEGLRRSHPHYFHQMPRSSGSAEGGAPGGFEGASWSDVLR